MISDTEYQSTQNKKPAPYYPVLVILDTKSHFEEVIWPQSHLHLFLLWMPTEFLQFNVC